jgi:MFS superfamily sulfate permease-like transporter
VVTPPAITLLLSASLNSTAVARSGDGSNRDHHDDDRES